MKELNHYDVLKVSPTATQAEIKQAYRRLVKLYHPDRNRETPQDDRIVHINAAYEVLGDRESRQSYDRDRRERISSDRSQRTAAAQDGYRSSRRAGANADALVQQWLERIYHPIDRTLARILYPLDERIEDLSADPFDDELMEEFCNYIYRCRDLLQNAQNAFRSLPNPASLAGVAADLYYCLNQLGDGIEELEFFTLNYDDRHLHTGQELFRIAARLQQEARASMNDVF
ncbi:MAG: DnaJ domain-containing protein [Cyanobacteriota bacterium]|nr:DnaJ domain-containing protein [Cyanobacteriota bacterium]